MPADIHLLPHAKCVQKPTLLGERRFLGLFCPDTPPRLDSAGRPDHCRLCGWPNAEHDVRYRIRWSVPEDQVKNMIRHAQCPRCHHRNRKEKLVEVVRLRGTHQTENYTMAEFAALLKSEGWTGMLSEYSTRRHRSRE